MERSGSGGTKAGACDADDGDWGAGCRFVMGGGVGSAACCCGSAADSGRGEILSFSERSKASERCGFGGSAFSGSGVASVETISTAIGSAVTEPNGCTSAKTIMVRADRWQKTDAVMPERM